MRLGARIAESGRGGWGPCHGSEGEGGSGLERGVSELPSSSSHAQGLSDFCSSPDTYLLNVTQEETGLSSGDHAWCRFGVSPWGSPLLCSAPSLGSRGWLWEGRLGGSAPKGEGIQPRVEGFQHYGDLPETPGLPRSVNPGHWTLSASLGAHWGPAHRDLPSHLCRHPGLLLPLQPCCLQPLPTGQEFSG